MFSLSMPLVFGSLAILFLRLLVFGAPTKESIMSSLIPLGPLGMSASALINLGIGLEKISSFGYQTVILDSLQVENISSLLKYGGLIVAFSFWSLGIFWVIIGAFLILSSLKSGLPFNMGWWGLIFPIGVYTLAIFSLGKQTGFEFFFRLGTFFSSILFFVWLMVFLKTVVCVWIGTIFNAPIDLSTSINSIELDVKQHNELPRRGSV